MTFGNGPGIGEQSYEPVVRTHHRGEPRPESMIHVSSLRRADDSRGTPSSDSELDTVNRMTEVYGTTVREADYGEFAAQNYITRCRQNGETPNPEAIAELRSLAD